MDQVLIIVGGRYSTTAGGLQARDAAGEKIHTAMMAAFPFSYSLAFLLSGEDSALFGFIVEPLGVQVSDSVAEAIRKIVEECMVSCGFTLVEATV